MKIIKVILSLIIFLALIAIGYIFFDITNVSYDWLGEGKTLSILSLTTLSLILLRFGLQAGSKFNVVHVVLATLSVLASFYLIQNTEILLDFWRFGIFLFLIQSTFTLWAKLKITSNSITHRLLFLTGPILVGTCIITGWLSSFIVVVSGLALLVMTVVSITALFKNRIN